MVDLSVFIYISIGFIVFGVTLAILALVIVLQFQRDKRRSDKRDL